MMAQQANQIISFTGELLVSLIEEFAGDDNSAAVLINGACILSILIHLSAFLIKVSLYVFLVLLHETSLTTAGRARLQQKFRN